MTDQQQQQAEQQQAKIVEDILSAKTLYDVLNVRPDDLSNLRKSYLTTSVKVHPDKNSHPQATQAFQRVAEAWGTLSDDSARAEYDAELLRGGNSNSNNNNNGTTNNSQQGRRSSANSTYYAYDFERSQMPSFQEALFMFATATAMFSGVGGGGTSGSGSSSAAASRSGSAVNAASDFVETLFWAQKLAEGRQQQQKQQQQQYQNQNEEYDNKNQYNQDRSGGGGANNGAASTAAETAANDPFTSGMALGSGLRAFANAQRAMGFKKSAQATDKAATTMQVAAVGAAALKAANENPAVKRTLERGSSALKNNPLIAKGFRASLKMAGSIISTLQEAQQQQQQQQQESATSHHQQQHHQQQRAGASTGRV